LIRLILRTVIFTKGLDVNRYISVVPSAAWCIELQQMFLPLYFDKGILVQT